MCVQTRPMPCRPCSGQVTSFTSSPLLCELVLVVRAKQSVARVISRGIPPPASPRCQAPPSFSRRLEIEEAGGRMEEEEKEEATHRTNVVQAGPGGGPARAGGGPASRPGDDHLLRP